MIYKGRGNGDVISEDLEMGNRGKEFERGWEISFYKMRFDMKHVLI